MQASPGRRDVVDHALRRRAVLLALRDGRVGREEVCDASPELRAAAEFDGRRVPGDCPVCRRPGLRVVAWVFGPGTRGAAGRSACAAEVAELAAGPGAHGLHEVEVCGVCGWNHLLVSAVVGTGELPAPRRRRA